MSLDPQLLGMLMELDSDEVSEVYDVLKHQRANLNRNAKNALSVGDKVWFEHKGNRIDCVLEKINRTKVIVRPLDGGRGWRVGPSCLTLIEPIISGEDVTKLNHAITEAAQKIVNQNTPAFNPLTGDFE